MSGRNATPPLTAFSSMDGSTNGQFTSSAALPCSNARRAVPSSVWVIDGSAPGAVAIISLLVAALAYSTWQRIQVRRERIEASRAVAYLVLGKACALAGAVVAGGYLLFALMFVTRWEADAPRDRVIRAGIAVLAGIGLSLAGWWLERACRVPNRDDEDQRDTATD